MVNGVSGRAHDWCVDFKASANELIEAGLALPTWFTGKEVCKRVLFNGWEIELYRPYRRDEYEMSIPYQKGNAWRGGWRARGAA